MIPASLSIVTCDFGPRRAPPGQPFVCPSPSAPAIQVACHAARHLNRAGDSAQTVKSNPNSEIVI